MRIILKNLLILLIFSLLISTEIFSQISVQSFKKLETDLTASAIAPKKDQNGDACAIIKVVTPETGFQWDNGTLGIVDAPRKTGEYWLYVPWGTKHLTISHDKLGILRNYIFNIPIEKATVYEMVLTTARITTIVEEAVIPMQYAIFTSVPDTADVYINDEWKGQTPLSIELALGIYTYRIEKALFAAVAGKIELKEKDGKFPLAVELKPHFGDLYVTSMPESGAAIILDNVETGKFTPSLLQRIASGSHNITLRQQMFQPQTLKVIINDGARTDIGFSMSPTFGTLNVMTDSDAEIFVNGTSKGLGKFNGRLVAGWYTVETKCPKHQTATKKIELTIASTIDVDLRPKPIYGTLKVQSVPFDATVIIDGVEKGKTPCTINELLIGNYEVLLRKEAFGDLRKSIEITENQITTMNEKLPTGVEISIESNPRGSQYSIDETIKGKSPARILLAYGKHDIVLVTGTRVVRESFNIEKDGKNSFFYDLKEEIPFTVTSNVDGTNIYIDGIHQGTTPTTLNLKQGTYRILYDKPNFIAKRRNYTVTGQPQTVKVNLTSDGYVGIGYQWGPGIYAGVDFLGTKKTVGYILTLGIGSRTDTVAYEGNTIYYASFELTARFKYLYNFTIHGGGGIRGYTPYYDYNMTKPTDVLYFSGVFGATMPIYLSKGFGIYIKGDYWLKTELIQRSHLYFSVGFIWPGAR